MQTQEAQFDIIASGYDFLEAPRVSPEGDIWFADLTGNGIFRKKGDQPVETMWADRRWVGGMAFDASGAVLCGGPDGIAALDPATGRTSTILSSIEGQPIIAINDMEADGRGGLFAGTIDFISIMEKGEAPAPGLFFHLSAAGDVTVLRRDVYASNGIALSPCGKWLYHSETSRGVWRYPLDQNGMPGEGELIIPLEDSDGLALDAQGDIWLACWRSGQLRHYSAAGECQQAFHFPYPHVASIDFGAADPHALYIATGGNADNPAAGAILRLRVDVPGLPSALTRLDALAVPA